MTCHTHPLDATPDEAIVITSEGGAELLTMTDGNDDDNDNANGDEGPHKE